MPRAIWTGAISFGLVNVPVRMYSAIDTTDLEFSLLHAKDGGHIGYRKVCKREDKPVPDDEIVKGYEVRKGKYVHVTDEDFDDPDGFVRGRPELDMSAFDETAGAAEGDGPDGEEPPGGPDPGGAPPEDEAPGGTSG